MDIATIRDVVRRIAPLYPVLSIDLFGSYADGRATSSSDVDLLVNFDLKKASLLDMSGLQLDVQDLLEKDVDVVAGPIGSRSILRIGNTVRLYEV